MIPKRIQRKRAKGWRMPDGAIYVARPTKWGNPYRVVPRLGEPGWRVIGYGKTFMSGNPDEPWIRLEAIEIAVAYYQDLYLPGSANWRQARIELAGKDLVCWCPITDQDGHPYPCHANVLLEVANG